MLVGKGGDEPSGMGVFAVWSEEIDLCCLEMAAVLTPGHGSGYQDDQQLRPFGVELRQIGM